MSNNALRADERISFRSLSHALAEYHASGADREAVFEPAPLDPERRALLEAVTGFVSLCDELGSLAGLVSVLESAAVSGEITLRDWGSAMWVIRQHAELLSDCALMESNAVYRLKMDAIYAARESGRREARQRGRPAKKPKGGADAGD